MPGLGDGGVGVLVVHDDGEGRWVGLDLEIDDEDVFVDHVPELA